MTFSTELGIWLVFCVIGLVASLLSLRYTVLLYRATVSMHGSKALMSGMRHMTTLSIYRTVGWLGFLGMGLLATIDEPPANPIGVTPIGLILRYVLIGSLGLWSLMTASDFLYSHRQWHRNDLTDP